MRKHTIIFLLIIAAVGATAQAQEDGSIVRLDPALDAIVPASAKLEKLVDHPSLSGPLEGPVWVRKGGYLLYSELTGNVINKWNPGDGKVSIFLKPSGFTGTDPTGVGAVVDCRRINGAVHCRIADVDPTAASRLAPNIGSNGTTLDRQGRVVFCASGDRQIVRLEADGRRTVLASHYEGKRLNGPNDLVYKSDGSLYFTDPGGFRGGDKDPKKELPFNGVYLLKNGKLQLLIKDMPQPNGLAFSPDEKYFYVDDTRKGVIMRYEVKADDTLANGQVLVDTSSDPAEGPPDGMKVDQKGNIYCNCPGGLWIVSPEGKHLGTIQSSERPRNAAFGDADGKTLYVTAVGGLYRIRLKIAGIRP